MSTSLSPVWFIRGSHLYRFISQFTPEWILKATHHKHNLVHDFVEPLLFAWFIRLSCIQMKDQ